MGALAAFALGVLTGVVIYWLIYRFYWRRWRAFLERDLAYFRAKVESAQYTNFGLERQLTAQKADLNGLRSKIGELERENGRALARLEEANLEKQALITHLDALRVELAAYKKPATEPASPGLPAPQHTNGKSHDPVLVVNKFEKASSPGLDSRAEVQKALPVKIPSSTNGRVKSYLPPEPLFEPVIAIARPRMEGDRLEIIQGIGPTIVKKLRLAGIDTFQALSQLSAERLRELVGQRTAKLLDVESVIQQARKLAGERKRER